MLYACLAKLFETGFFLLIPENRGLYIRKSLTSPFHIKCEVYRAIINVSRHFNEFVTVHGLIEYYKYESFYSQYRLLFSDRDIKQIFLAIKIVLA